jgi:pyrimidine operon attenuation protein/uracil phosphoribosyltransferase
MYARTPRWDAVPSACLPISLATIIDPEHRDIKVHEDYIVLKEKHIAQHQNVEKNIGAMEMT